MEINAYILLGFLPPQVPSEKEIKKRYLDLARLHHPDAGGDGEVFKVINNAYHWINDNKNPGPLYFIKEESPTRTKPRANKDTENWNQDKHKEKHQDKETKNGWKKNHNGNFVMKDKEGFLVTVYLNRNQWGWVHRNVFSRLKFKTALEAMQNFENHYREKS